jgi:hypothetical protein
VTEVEWLECQDPEEFIRSLDPNRHARQLLLFYVAVCDRLAHLFVHEDTQQAIAFFRAAVDHPMTAEQWEEAHTLASSGSRGMTPSDQPAPISASQRALEFAADAMMSVAVAAHPLTDVGRKWDYHGAAVKDLACSLSYGRYPGDRPVASVEPIRPDPTEYAEQMCVLRDLIHNPFSTVAFDVGWRTSTVESLARLISESQDFSPMPILADALEEAGCDNAEILNHLRGPGPHVRGCWAVDLARAKE